LSRYQSRLVNESTLIASMIFEEYIPGVEN
jgi:hypothetical protein